MLASDKIDVDGVPMAGAEQDHTMELKHSSLPNRISYSPGKLYAFAQ